MNLSAEFATEEEELNFLRIENQRLKAEDVEKDAQISSLEENLEMMKEEYKRDFHHLSAKYRVSIGSLRTEEKGQQTEATYVETAVQTLPSEEMYVGESAEHTVLQASMGEENIPQEHHLLQEENHSFWSRFKTVAKKVTVASLAVVALGYSLSFYATETFGFQTFTNLPPY